VIRKFAQLAILDAWRVAASGSERSIRKASHRVTFDYTPRPGFLYVRARAISSRCNDNWDAFPADEIEKGYKTFLGKPCFVNHHNANHRRARGVIVAAALHRDRNPDGSPDTWVELLHEIDAVRFPRLCKAILSGRVNRTSMGVDCEHSTCSACGNKATSPAEYCQHMPGKKGMRFRRRNQVTGKLEESIIHEICAGLTFFENSFLVEDPADPTAYVVDKPYLHPVTGARTASLSQPGEVTCPACSSPRAMAEGASEMAQCSDCGTHYNQHTGREYTPEEVDVAHAAQANHEEYERRRKAGEQLFSHFTPNYTHPLPGWGEGPELLRARHLEEHQHKPFGIPVDPLSERGYPSYRIHQLHALEHSEPFRVPEGPVRREHLSARQREGDERPYGDYTMRYRTEDQGERRPRHVIEAWHPEDGKVGELNWYGTTGTIHNIDVDEGHSRRGIATAMWNWGQQMSPKPRHSGDRTTQGTEWAKSVGGPGLRRRQGATWTPDPEGSDWIESRDAHALEKMGRDHPHGAAIQIAQQRTAFDHPNMHTQLPRPESEGSYIFSETGGKVLSHMLQAGGYRGDASNAFVATHRNPESNTSNPAMDRRGNPGVVLHPDRWDYGTLAHEAAHHVANGPERFNDPSMTDEEIHGPAFAQAYSRTLGVVSRGADEDFARHHADARREVSDYRARVHGLPRIDGAMEHEAASQIVTGAISWEGQEAADADNLYPASGSHHVACGRHLRHGRTAAALDIIEERLHHPGDPAVHPVRLAQEGARAYSSKVGLPDPHAEQYSHIETNPGRIRRLAHAYHALPMNDPGAHAAFADMARQVHHQYDHLTNAMGVRVEPVDQDPYANHLEMAHDLERNRHLAVLSTRVTGPHGFFDDDTNDRFRAVHDAFGHAATGRSFDRHGEEAAWLAHSRMFTGPARHAMTTETRGQNSMLIATGRFADQKTALMPRELMEREAAQLYDKPEDHPFFQANPVSEDNIKNAWYHHTTEDERNQASRWYPDAHIVAKSIAHGNAALGAGMLSAYSPLTRWPANMFNAARSIHEGRAMGTQKGDGAIMRVHWQPAQRILAGEHHSQVFSPRTAMKTRAFAHLIEHGGNTDEDLDAGTAHVVVDRHALSVAAGRRLTDEEFAQAPISKHRYYHHVASKYVGAAKDISDETGRRIDPATIQAGTWLAQVRRNEAEDATMRGRLGRGRITRGQQDVRRWQEFAREHHPDLPPSARMHLGALQAMGGDPPLRVPPSVDTLRPEACPVCGNSDVFKGQRCPVCGFVSPPDIFRDPDIDQARANREALEEGKVESPYPEGPADEAAMAGAEPGMNPPIGSGEDADEQLMHPDQIAPDGVPGVQPEGAPGQGMLEPSGEEDELAGPGELDENGQPVEPEEEQLEGAQLEEQGEEEQQAGEQEEEQGAEDEAAGEGAEEEGLSPGKEQDEDERPGGKMPKRSAATATVAASERAVAELRRENALLRHQLQFIAELAGVGPELEEIRRQADLANPAQPVPDPPQEPATSTTEQALVTGAPTGSGSGTARGPGHTEDDPSRPGTTPGSLSAVPAEQTTTAITPGVEMQTPPASQLTDVTAPVTGTNPSQDGGVPIEQRRIETDVRVNPNPLAAQGPGIGGQGNDGTAFPWTLAARQALDGPQSPEDERGARTMASIRLARLQVQAGLARGDELEVGAAIERDARLSLRDIEHEIDTISRMAKATAQAQPRYPRNLAPRQAARSAPSFAGAPAPVMAMTAGATADGGDDSDLFID
jgi:hypothetical protein